jgi:thiamine biosynthesis lipoprotein
VATICGAALRAGQTAEADAQGAGGVQSGNRSGPERYTGSASVFGAEAKLILLHEEESVAAQAMDAVLVELREVEKVLSLYRPDSAMCRLNREGVLTRPHPFLVEVLRKAQKLSELSGGAFDVTVQPLWELYAAARKAGRIPKAAEIEAARRKVNWRKVEVAQDRIRLGQRGMAITLNALAQGFAADRVLAALRSHSIRHALVNTGEIGAMGCKEDGVPWTLGIQHPRRPDAYAALVRLSDCCMATSGDYATAFSNDFLRHHIFDPATGRSPQELASVTVVAPSGLDADGASTAVMVMGAKRGMKLLESFPGAEAFLVLKDGRTIKTPRFPET